MSHTDISERLSAIKKQLDSLYVDGAENELKTCLAYCNRMLLDNTVLTASDANYDDKRSVIAGMRTAVHKLQENLEQVMTKSAEVYRQQFGKEQKEAFEQLSAELQQQSNPEAYRFFSAFHQADQLLDELSRLNTALMDEGHRLEQEHRHSDAAAAAGDKEPAAAEADVHRYDTDPVPPSLSP